MKRLVWLAAGCLLLIGCGFDPTAHPILANHVISVDASGFPYCPVTEVEFQFDPQDVTKRLLKGGEDATPRDSGGAAHDFDGYVANIFYRMDRYFQAVESADGAKGKPRRILIFVHGGLNRQSKSLRRASELIEPILYDPDEGDSYYPIFITWPSGFWDTYTEALNKIRKGEPVQGAVASLTVPLFFLTALASGLGRLPMTFYNQSETDLRSAESLRAETRRQLREEKGKPVRDRAPVPEMANPPQTSSYTRDYPILSFLWNGLCYPTQLPAKLLTTVLVDGPGGTSWHNMVRRTRTMYRRSDEFRPDHPFSQEPTGALAIFFRKLAARIESDPANTYEITLISHSMGAIVINELLGHELYREGNFGAAKLLPIKTIVYMAPASSIRDANATLIPYLQRRPNTRFYLLTLNPVAEAREVYFDKWYLGPHVPFIGEPLPRGGLLEWIDNYYAVQHTPMDRTLGKWNNIMAAKHIFSDVSERVFIRSFDVHVTSGSIPQKHADFNYCPFWKKKFWWGRQLAVDFKRKKGQLENLYYFNWIDDPRFQERIAARKRAIDAAREKSHKETK